jgi:hypothetical protein
MSIVPSIRAGDHNPFSDISTRQIEPITLSLPDEPTTYGPTVQYTQPVVMVSAIIPHPSRRQRWHRK